MDAQLFRWSYDYVGDLAEAVALVWPGKPGANREPELGEVVDDVFASVRSVCRSFVSSSHDQDFFQKAKKPACNASPSPISMEGQCKSAYVFTTITSRAIVSAILTNSPRKKFAGYEAPGRLATDLRRKANKKLGRVQATPPRVADIAPRVPAINPAIDAETNIVIACRRIALNIISAQ